MKKKIRQEKNEAHGTRFWDIKIKEMRLKIQIKN